MAAIGSRKHTEIARFGNISATTDANNKLALFNNTGHTVKIVGAKLFGLWTYSATNYYTITLYDQGGTAIAAATLNAASSASITTDVTMGTVTEREIADGEAAFVTFAQTGNGLSISNCAVAMVYQYLRSHS